MASPLGHFFPRFLDTNAASKFVKILVRPTRRFRRATPLISSRQVSLNPRATQGSECCSLDLVPARPGLSSKPCRARKP